MANYFHGGHLASATMPTDQQLLNRRRRSARRLPIGIDALQAEPTRRGCGSEGSTDQRVTSSVPREDLDERKVSRLRILDANGTDTDLWCEGLRLPSCPRWGGGCPCGATIEDPVVIQRILSISVSPWRREKRCRPREDPTPEPLRAFPCRQLQPRVTVARRRSVPARRSRWAATRR